ncbi:MAG: carotenoid 1,2-hydratase [Massilia sp.]|nr:carotenoid 1,2-hydratase [Massilia sp.]
MTYRRSQTIVDEQLITTLSGFKRLLATLTQFDGSYLRFTGNVQLEHFINGKLIEDVSDPGIWEMMYFGRVRQSSPRLSPLTTGRPASGADISASTKLSVD